MQVSARGVFRAGLASFIFGLFLVFLLAIMANGLGSAGVSVFTVQVVGFVIGFLTRMYAGIIGGRKARAEDLGRWEVALTAALGCAAGFAALQIANMFTEVVILQEQLTLAWNMLYDVVLWFVAGGLGGLITTRTRRRKRRRTSTA